MVGESQGRLGVWVFGVVYAILLSPLLMKYFDYLLSRQYYHWVPFFVVILAVAFVFQWRKAPASEMRPSQWLIGGALSFSFLLTAVAYLYYTGWVAMGATIVATGALCIYLSGIRTVDRLFGIWACLFFLVRLPDQVERRLLALFEGFSAKIGSLIVDYSGTYHVIQGDLMVIEGYEIDVGRICNGYFSIISLAAVAALYVLWRKRSLFHVIALIPASLIVAAGVNVLRVGLVGVVYAKSGQDIMLSSWMWGLLVGSFGLGILGIVSVDALLALLLQPITNVEKRTEGAGLARLWTWLTSFRVASIFDRFSVAPEEGARSKGLATLCVLGLVTLVAFEGPILYGIWTDEAGEKRFMYDKKEELAIIDPAAVQFSRPGWEVLNVEEEARDFTSIWGQYSFIWKLRYRDVIVIMALDYPFDKWHDVRVCYTRLGWKIDTMAMSVLEKTTGWGASETQMTLPTGDYGFILCSHMDHLGNKVIPKPTANDFNMVGYYLHPKQWQAPYKMSVDKDTNTFYQTQVMVTTAFPLDEPTRREISEMYGEFREQTRKLIEEEAKKK
jgi:exosortase/archaeosortase family protein